MEIDVPSPMNASLNLTKKMETITTMGDTFMGKVEAFMSFKIATSINMYWFPVLIPLGLVGNTLSFLVMVKPNNRKMSTCIYMAGLSINDNIMMLESLHNWLVSVVKVHAFKPLECRFASFWALFGLQNSTFQVLTMTVDKYVAIRWPYRAATYSTSKRAKVITIGLFIILLIYMNCTIVKTVGESRKMFEMGVNRSSELYSQGGNKGMETRKTMKSAENQLTVMLLLVTTLFLILLIPTYV